MGVIPRATTLPPQLRTGPVVIASVVSSSIGSSVTTPSASNSVSYAPTVTSDRSSLPGPSISIPLLATPTPLTATTMPGGIFMGDNAIPIPKKLVNKILNLEFIEMYELLPENWPDIMAEDESRFYATFGKKKPPAVTNVLTWVECYSSMVSVLSSAYPTYIPEFMAYMSIIIKCQKRFEGLGWFAYDRAFRRQVATTKNLQWSKTDSTLFSLAFTGKAKQITMCDLCFSTNHGTAQCPEAMGPAPFVPWQQWQPIMPQCSNPRNEYRVPASSKDNNIGKICGLFNSKGGCTYGKKCKFGHVCSMCKGNHTRSECSKLPPQKKQRNTA